MTELQDPIEIYRASLAELAAREETSPPVVLRAEAWPYPDLQRVWVRIETSPFAAAPDVAFTLTDPDGAVVCSFFIMELPQPYQAVTLHLRQPPRPGAAYRLEIELSRADAVLDQRSVTFELAFKEPPQ